MAGVFRRLTAALALVAYVLAAPAAQALPHGYFQTGAAGPSGTPVTGLLIAATKGKIATGTRASTSLDSDVVRGEYTLGPGCWTELRGLVMNWWALASVTGEATNAGALSYELALTNPATLKSVRFTTAAANVGSAPISATTQTDAIPASAFGLVCFPGGSQWWVTARRTTASSSDFHPWWGTNQYLNREGEFEYQYNTAAVSAATIAANYIDGYPTLLQFFKDNASTNQGAVTGVVRPDATASGISVFGGFALIGKNNAPTRAVCLIGDSIADGTNDTQTPQPSLDGNGMFSRGLRDANGVVQAGLLKITMPGDRATWFVGVHALRAGLLGYCNAAIIEYGHNDQAGGRTAAQLFSDNTAIAGYAHAAGINYIALTLQTPFTTSTDAWATTGNQTPVAGFETSGTLRDAYNTLATAAASGHTNNINAVINVSANLELSGVWLGNLSADGIHPNAAASALAAPTLRSFYAAVPLAKGGL